jgi:hypothetical protein
MTFPRLSQDGATPFEATLLRAARHDAAGADPRKTLKALGLVSATAYAGTTVGLGLRRLSKAGATKWGLVAAVIGGVATVQYVGRPAPPPAERIEIASSPRAEPLLPPPEPILVTPPAPRVEVRPTAARPRRRERPVAKSSLDTLAEELALVEKARLQLSQKDGVAAVASVEQYLARFPQGRLLAEAELIRIQAVRSLQGPVAAARLAKAYLRRHPNSPHAPTLERIIQAADPP